jgi:hypothetical protein
MAQFKASFKGGENYHVFKRKMGTMISKRKPPEEIDAEIDRAYYSGELTLEETQHLLTYVDGLLDGGIIALMSALLHD